MQITKNAQLGRKGNQAGIFLGPQGIKIFKK